MGLRLAELGKSVDRMLRGVVVHWHARDLAKFVAKNGGIGVVVDRGDGACDVTNLDSTFKSTRGAARDDDLRGGHGQASCDGCRRVGDAHAGGDDEYGVARELAQGVALLVVAFRADVEGFDRVGTGEGHKGVKEGLCFHDHRALDEGVNRGKIARRGQGQGHEWPLWEESSVVG